MKILLLNPPAEQKYVKEARCQHRAAVFQSVYPPLTLAYMASLLRDKNEVRLVDAIGEEISLGKVKETLMEFDPDLVVVNTTTPTVENDLSVIKELKDIIDTTYAFFGVHATHFASDIIKHKQVDVVIYGEPELTVRDLAEKDYGEIKGIVYKKDDKVVKNPPREFMDLKELPIPDWDMVNLENYRMPIVDKPYVLLTTGRGCPYSCTFCVSGSYYGKRYRKRPVENVIDEIKFVKSLGIDDFFFFVETFTLDKDYVLRLCDKILEEKLQIRWVCNSRTDTVDFEMLSKMEGAGCWLISFGIESSNQGILNKIKKGMTVEQSASAVKVAKKVGIATIGHFIFGLPGETEETMQETIKFSKKIQLDFVEYYIAVPFPGCELFDEIVLADLNWKNFEYSHNVVQKGLDLEKARKRAYREFYLRPKTGLNMFRIFGLRRIPKLLSRGVKFIRNI